MPIKRYILCLFLVSYSFSQLLDNIDMNAVKSLALPGWGELEISQNKRARNFLILEACSWLSFLGSYYSNNWYNENYTSFGNHHAGIDLNSINSDDLSLLIVHMSQYDNIYDYNETMQRQRRPDDSYSETSNYYWNWDSTSNRQIFNDLRIKSSLSKKINNFTVAALIINRFLSFFDVVYLNGKKQYKVESVAIPNSNNGILLNLNIHF